MYMLDGCVAEDTILEPLEPGGLSVILEWPESDIGQTISLPCPCGNLSAVSNESINKNATRECGGTFTQGAKWDIAMSSPCNFSSVTRRLCQVANVSQKDK